MGCLWFGGVKQCPGLRRSTPGGIKDISVMTATIYSPASPPPCTCDSVSHWIRHCTALSTYASPPTPSPFSFCPTPCPRDVLERLTTTGGGGGSPGHLGLTETQRGRLWTACGQRFVDSKNSQTTRQQPAHPQHANHWAPLTRKRHTMPHPAQPQHTNHWAPRTRKRHQQEHRP